jgi:hypothetical protein
VGASSSAPASPIQPLLQKLRDLSSDPVLRQQQLDQLAAQIPDADLERTLDHLWAAAEPGSARDLSMILLRRWAGLMPGVAASWLLTKPAGERRHAAGLAIATAWAGADPDAAAEWVRNWPVDRRPAGLLAVAYEASQQSPTNALWLAAELPADESRDQLIEHAVREWASRDAETALSWAAGLGATPLRDQVLASLSLAVGDKAPEKGVTLALETLPEGRKKEDVVVGLVQRWAQTEPDKAAAWVQQFPEGRLRESAVENLVKLWAEKTPEAPGTWIGTLQGDVRDTAAAAYASTLASSDPASAAEWIGSIENTDAREREQERLAERWLAMDAAKARAWIEASLPPETAARLLSENKSGETQPETKPSQ